MLLSAPASTHTVSPRGAFPPGLHVQKIKHDGTPRCHATGLRAALVHGPHPSPWPRSLAAAVALGAELLLEPAVAALLDVLRRRLGRGEAATLAGVELDLAARACLQLVAERADLARRRDHRGVAVEGRERALDDRLRRQVAIGWLLGVLVRVDQDRLGNVWWVALALITQKPLSFSGPRT